MHIHKVKQQQTKNLLKLRTGLPFNKKADHRPQYLLVRAKISLGEHRRERKTTCWRG